MFVLATFVEYPHLEDYTLRTVELCETLDEAQKRSAELKSVFIEEYGAVAWNVSPSNGAPFEVATNDEVTFRSYIAEVPAN